MPDRNSPICQTCGTEENTYQFPERGDVPARCLCLPCALRHADPHIPEDVVAGAVAWVHEAAAEATGRCDTCGTTEGVTETYQHSASGPGWDLMLCASCESAPQQPLRDRTVETHPRANRAHAFRVGNRPISTEGTTP
ncbi:hypothetical protein [Streptomyces pinistramenti]|uniref:hypothetical protein n=1 Tax=Streptomyces pinistramenti TaxID=2884812 RepID=UPI001D08ABA8|nr:hypothetical protein [Streptomyces pinistramenti]MCB5909828.1 hypothetical protein [Streptomyces pinistramenti]